MKTIKFQSPILLAILLFFFLPFFASAQKFRFAVADSVFTHDWQDNGAQNVTTTKNKKVNHYHVTALKKVFNHEWILDTDGYDASKIGDLRLHIGKDDSDGDVSYYKISTNTKFKDVDMVRIKTYYGKKREKNKISHLLFFNSQPVSETTIEKIDNREQTIRFLPNNTNNAGTLSFCMKDNIRQRGALYLYFIEVASILKDTAALNLQHLKQDSVYSYEIHRTFKALKWNTICLPFDANSTTIRNALKGTKYWIGQFTGKVNKGVMQFQYVKEMKAGIPYLLISDSTEVNPIFSNVVYKKDVQPQRIEDTSKTIAFVGTFNPTTLKADGTQLFLNSDHKLYKPKQGKQIMRGMRCFFEMKPSATAAAKKMMYSIAIDTDEDSTNGIKNINQSKQFPSVSNRIYNLQGIQVNSDIHLLPKGIYIKGASKIYVRGK